MSIVESWDYPLLMPARKALWYYVIVGILEIWDYLPYTAETLMLTETWDYSPYTAETEVVYEGWEG